MAGTSFAVGCLMRTGERGGDFRSLAWVLPPDAGRWVCRGCGDLCAGRRGGKNASQVRGSHAQGSSCSRRIRYGPFFEKAPRNAAIVWNNTGASSGFLRGVANAAAASADPLRAPLSIDEVHLGAPGARTRRENRWATARWLSGQLHMSNRWGLPTWKFDAGRRHAPSTRRGATR